MTGRANSQIFIGRRTTASLLDDADHDPDAFHRGSTKEERITRRLVADEKERELAKKLGALGNGIGADYLRKKNSAPLPNPNDNAKCSIRTAAGCSIVGTTEWESKRRPAKSHKAEEDEYIVQ